MKSHRCDSLLLSFGWAYSVRPSACPPESKAAEFTGLWYRRFILGEWVQAEGAVYEHWTPDLHAGQPLATGVRLLSLALTCPACSNEHRSLYLQPA